MASPPSVPAPPPLDLLVVGGGINGVGVARDAAMRGLRVLLCDKDDLGSHTSSASSKLVHGGLRYLEHYEFRLVRESLSEREVLMSIAPHLVHPMEFCLPHAAGLRPAWMIRAGLFLYDRLGARRRLAPSRSVDLKRERYGAGLKPEFRRGFVYSDCRVDDARLVIANARSAAAHGAIIMPRSECMGAVRVGAGTNPCWDVELRTTGGSRRVVRARALVNVAGPWVKQLLVERLGHSVHEHVKQVKGSHIVVPRRFSGEHAYLVQNDDRRVVFIIPFERDFTLIGTTDVEVSSILDQPAISTTEVDYLCHAANRYLATPITPADVVWSYSGVRPLYDDGTADPSAITRDYTLSLDAPGGSAPLLSVFGGKLTTYRRLGEAAVDRLSPHFPGLRRSRTALEPLPGGNFVDFARLVDELCAARPRLDRELLRALAHRHGSDAVHVLGSAQKPEQLGEHFGDTLYEAEIAYLVAAEWALTADDVLWRRTKCGLHLAERQRQRVAAWLAERLDGAKGPASAREPQPARPALR